MKIAPSTRSPHDAHLLQQLKALERDYPDIISLDDRLDSEPARALQFTVSIGDPDRVLACMERLPDARIAKQPAAAEYLFYLFMDAKDCDALVGDLQERYLLIHKKFGVRRANFWYWTQALASIGPIVWAWGRKLALKPVLAISAWLLTHGLLKDGSLPEWVKNIVAELTKRLRG